MIFEAKMTNLFKKAALFTDIHFGKRNNERQHNEDCEAFVEWFIDQAKINNVDTIIFLGDYFDNRNSIHLSTLNYGLSSIEKLNNAGIPVYFILGNHDLYYKEKRELSSVAIGRNFPNIHIIDEITYKDNVTFCPWLVKDEWKSIEHYASKSSYVFGHFELPHFMMNAMVEMSDHGGLKAEHLQGVEFMSFSGHFHKRQVRDKICYLGNPFPHNFSDVWDEDRGMAILEWGKFPEFKKFPKAPSYKSLNLSELLESPDQYINSSTYAKITNDLDMSYEEIQLIKDIYSAHYEPRRMDISSPTRESDDTDYSSDTEFQSIDQIVIDGLTNIDSISIDKNLLIEIFRGLE